MKLYWIFLLLISTSLFSEIISSGRISRTKIWTEYSSNTKLNKLVLINYLKRSSIGEKLIRAAELKAESFDDKLINLISEGTTSITDTTLYRKFKPGEIENIEYESKSKVFLNRSLSQYDALLDLAHELTHFVYRDAFNPYQQNFTLKKFIKNTIEGRGGEAHAFVVECKIVRELFPKEMSRRHNCKKILKANHEISLASAIEKFYAVGDYYENFTKVLDELGVPEITSHFSSKAAQFISSAYGVPYPVAALYEYQSVMKKVCENDKNRYEMYQGRSIASVDFTKFKNNFFSRCKSFL